MRGGGEGGVSIIKNVKKAKNLFQLGSSSPLRAKVGFFFFFEKKKKGRVLVISIWKVIYMLQAKVLTPRDLHMICS